MTLPLFSGKMHEFTVDAFSPLPWHLPLSCLDIAWDDSVLIAWFISWVIIKVVNWWSSQSLRQVHHHLTSFSSNAAVCSSKSKSLGFTRLLWLGQGLFCPPERYWYPLSSGFQDLFNLQGLLELDSVLLLHPQPTSLLPRLKAIAIFSSIVKREAVPILGSWKHERYPWLSFLPQIFNDLPANRRFLRPPIDCQPRYSSKWFLLISPITG